MLSELRSKGLLWPAVMTVIGVAFLIALGNWQMRRLTWKEGLIAAIAERTHAEPVLLAEAERRAGDIEYLRVWAKGTYLNDRELDFYAFDEQAGPGWHILTPLRLADGGIVFVNRGFVPDELKDPAKRKEGQLAGEVEIVGLARKPETAGTFTPANDTAKNVWYWRDLPAMAAAAVPGDKARVVPFVIDAELEPRSPGGWPKGGTTRLEPPNRHLEYALTWYGLAAALVGVFGAFAVTRWRLPRA
ncbi:MAG TPA: SURF1 family protein [Hyphomicrobium sp.]|nr:SURF1 family protein [Hyphomicrobium sp.]